MGVVRLHLHLIAIVTAFAQLAMPALASAALCCNIPPPAAAESLEDSLHAEHHHAKAHQTESHHSADGTLRSACQFDHQIFELLLGTTALMPPPTSVTPPSFGVVDDERPTIGRPRWIATADLPPPKA